MADYNIGEAFERIEDELISSMIRNFKRHKAEETKEGIQWSQWQAEQLKALEDYKRQNAKKFKKRFNSVNDRLENAIRAANAEGGMEQEEAILRAVQKGATIIEPSSAISGSFFKLNERKLDTLINATKHDMKKAETAVLRMANDQYRKIIYNAQVYASTGAGTYAKAIDMATKDFLAAGINCIEYKNGRRVNIKSYAEMALRTANKRAYLQGEGTKRQEWGVSTVILNKRANSCPLCARHVGKVYIDDVWSGGSKNGISNVTGIKYPLLSEAMMDGLYHPNCKDSHTTYFEGINTAPEGSEYTTDELNDIAEKYAAEQKQQHAEGQAKKYDRLAKYSLDSDNKRIYSNRAQQWQEKAETIAKRVENSDEDGIIEASDGGFVYKPVTEDSINRVPKLDVSDSEEFNERYHTACQDLLREVLKHTECQVGTEFSIVYNYNIERISGYDYRIGYLGGVKIDVPNVMYHAFHNHGSGEMLSFSDIFNFVDRQKQMSIAAVGNNGNVYVLSKGKGVDRNGYLVFLRNKAQEVIYSTKEIVFTLSTVAQIAKNKIDMPNLTEQQSQELQSAILKATKESLEAGEKYGYKYIKGTP